MTTANLYDHTGKKLSTTTLPKEIFSATVNPTVITQALHVYRFNQAQKTRKAKTRGEVSLTTAKPYRQKGTGRARHGAMSAPIFVGGGVAHGPKNVRPQNKRLTRNMRRLSIISALSSLANKNSVSLIKNLDKLTPKTSDLNQLLTKLELNHKTLLLTNETYPKLIQASKNLTYLDLSRYSFANAYRLLNSDHLLLDATALPSLFTWLTGKSLPATTPKTTKPASKTTKKTK